MEDCENEGVGNEERRGRLEDNGIGKQKRGNTVQNIQDNSLRERKKNNIK